MIAHASSPPSARMKDPSDGLPGLSLDRILQVDLCLLSTRIQTDRYRYPHLDCHSLWRVCDTSECQKVWGGMSTEACCQQQSSVTPLPSSHRLASRFRGRASEPGPQLSSRL